MKLPNPEEKAENTRISLAQQKAQIISQFSQLGFDIKLKEQHVSLDEAEFVISGEPVPTAKMQGEQQAMGLAQQKQQMEQAEQQQQMQEQQQGMMGGMGGGEDMGGGEESIMAMQKTVPRSQRKFKGRTGGVTPDWHDKAPNEERDIDEYAEARASKNELTLSKTWVESLLEKGFSSPVIKEVTSDLSQMWFAQSGIDYVAQLSPSGITDVSKATFGDPTRFSRVQQKPPRPSNNGVIPLDDEQDY